MSTTFEVYTPTIKIPSFGAVLELSNAYLKGFLHDIGVKAEIRIDVEVRKRVTHECISFHNNDQAKWSEDSYAWFVVNNQAGGCDAYCDVIKQLDHDRWEDEFKLNSRAANVQGKMRTCLASGFYWWFRRSAGQPSIINLSYGIIAAAFAELTDGIIYSDDNAWDYNMFPTEAGKFLSKYFRPEYPVVEHGSWARKCIDDLVANGK